MGMSFVRKTWRRGQATDWLHPVTIDNEMWQDVAPYTQDVAAIRSEGVAKRDVG